MSVLKTSPIVLASQSPRRAALLHQIGVEFTVMAADIDERPQVDEAAADYVQRLALEKARYSRAHARLAVPVLGSDTAVVVDGEIFGKPKNREHALNMLARLSGRSHQVLTAVALVDQSGEKTAICSSTVHMRSISSDEASAYWDTGEPQGKAGAYAIQGQGAVFIEYLEGSYSGVMGLPLFETARLLSAG